MHDVQMTAEGRLEMRWVPVADDRGRTKMQAVWIELDAARPAQVHHAA